MVNVVDKNCWGLILWETLLIKKILSLSVRERLFFIPYSKMDMDELE